MGEIQDNLIAKYKWAFYRANLKERPEVEYRNGWYVVIQGLSRSSYRMMEFATMINRLDKKAIQAGRPEDWKPVGVVWQTDNPGEAPWFAGDEDAGD